MILAVEPDRFNSKLQGLTAKSGSELRDLHVRRPTRGIVIKDDTFATLRVVSLDDNSPVYLVDAGSNRKLTNDDKGFLEVNGQRYTDVYSNFLIQNVQEERMEKAQILETFGEPFIFLFGERARMLNISGVLLNSFDFNWRAEWMENYERFLRGTRCVESDSRVFLSFDETLVGGYIIGCTVQENSQDKNFVQFQFQLFVTNYSSFSKVGDPSADPTGNNGVLPDEISPDDFQLGRPSIVTPTSLINFRLQTGQFDTTESEKGFFDNLQSAVQSVRDTWSQVQTIVNGVTKTISGMLNGDVVRVPHGFEGSLVFDDDPTAEQIRNMQEEEAGANAQVIKYTTFSDNFDEYVGTSDHYGTAVTSAGANRVIFEGEDPLVRDSRLLTKAREVWAENGFIVPDNDLSPTAAFLLRKGVGSLSAGLTKLWRTGSVLDGLKAAANVPFVGSGLAGGIALFGRSPSKGVANAVPGLNPE